MKPNLDFELEMLRQRREQLESTLQAQREYFCEDYARIYASEQGPLEPDEEITDPRSVRG